MQCLPMKSVCSFDINFYFILSALQPDASLYMTFSNVISLQFFKNCFGLSPLENI